MNKEEYFKNIYKKNYPHVIKLCLGYVDGKEDLAKDLAQEVFIKVWQHLHNFRKDATLSTWIYKNYGKYLFTRVTKKKR